MSRAKVVVDAVTKYGGIRALGAIFSSRKGIFGIVAIGLSYYLLIGRLPEDAPEDVFVRMAEVFGILVGVISGLFIGGTALEDALEKGAKNAGPDWSVPLAKIAGESYTDYIKDGQVDVAAIISKAVKEELGKLKK
jgi:hypothetical protein